MSGGNGATLQCTGAGIHDCSVHHVEGVPPMTYAAGQAEPADSPILHAAIAMAPQIRAAADEIERARRLPASIVEALKASGVLGMAMPRVWGGPELDPMTQFRVLEALAMADASVAWCVMINCDGGYITAFLVQDVGRAMYPDLEVGTAATATPTGQAQLVPGGYRVSGRFPFASGCQHSEWDWLGCVVTADGTPRADGNAGRRCDPLGRARPSVRTVAGLDGVARRYPGERHGADGAEEAVQDPVA